MSANKTLPQVYELKGKPCKLSRLELFSKKIITRSIKLISVCDLRKNPVRVRLFNGY